MHILFVTPAFPPMPGGGERYAASLAGSLRKRGHTVNVVTSWATQEHDLWIGAKPGSENPSVESSEFIARRPVRPFPGGRTGLMGYRKLMVLLSALPGDQSELLNRLAARVPWITGIDTALAAVPAVDVVHAFNLSWESAAVAAMEMARMRSVPLVVTPFAHFGVGDHDRVARNSTMDHQLRLLREAQQVLVLTDMERGALVGYGIPLNQISVLGGSADPLPENWAAALPLLAEMGIPQCFALFLGRASRDKGAISAAEAILDLRQNHRDIALIMVGSSSPEFDAWLARASRNDRQGIIQLGIVSDDLKHALLERSAMLLLPSRSDSYGIVLLEAWQHGKPVIGARAGGIPGVIDEGQNGLLVDYGDVVGLAAAIAQLLDDPALAAALGAAGRQKVTNELTWEKSAARAEAAYLQAMQAA